MEYSQKPSPELNKTFHKIDSFIEIFMTRPNQPAIKIRILTHSTTTNQDEATP